MDATSGIIGAMFMISNSLLYPVIIILLGLVAWSLISVGQLVSEYASRSRDIAKLKVGCRAARKYMQMQDYKKAAEVLRSSGSNDFLRSQDYTGFHERTRTVIGNQVSGLYRLFYQFLLTI